MRRPSDSDTIRARLRAPVYISVLAALLVFLLASRGRADTDATTPVDPGPVWTCPVQAGATICQGNGGDASHTGEGAFYAFDYDVPEGTAIVAARDGVVSEVVIHNTLGGPGPKYAGFANRIAIEHADGLRSMYCHLAPGGASVRVGEHVIQGERIGRSGNTGWSSGPHFHFAVVDKAGVSVPVHFKDFPRSRGIPQRGDRHQRAPDPVVPQKEIDKTRLVQRAVNAAEDRGWKDVALLLLEDHRPRRKHGEYRGNQALVRDRRRLAREMIEHAELVRGSPEIDVEAVFLLVRYDLAAGHAKAPKETREALKQAMKALSPEHTKLARALRNPTTRLQRSMAEDCREDVEVVRDYAQMMRAGPEPVRELARARFEHLVQHAITRYDLDVARLKADARAARVEYEHAYLAHAEHALEDHQAFLKRAAKIPGEHAEAVKQRLRQVRKDAKEIGRLLDS